MTTQCLHDEYYVVKIDGRAKSGHHRFVDALRAALVLKISFVNTTLRCGSRKRLK